MRGQAIPIPVPRSGWVTDFPRHQIPPDALFDGQNLCIEPDGLLQPRKGMERLTDTNGDVLAALNGRVMAGVGFVDANGAAQIVVSTLTSQYIMQNESWVQLVDVPTTGDKNISYRLVQFGQLNGNSIVYLCNGALEDDLLKWAVGDPGFATVNNSSITSGHFATFKCSDMAVVADRLVVIDTNENGGAEPGRHSQRVRWSSVLDGSNWPALAFNDLAGIGNLIAIRQSSRTTAVVYGENGAFTMSGVPGSDAGAFIFDRLNNVIVPPCCPSGIVERGGQHWFTGVDLNVWVCDGQNAQIASPNIHTGLMNNLAGGAAGTIEPGVSDQRPVAVYDKIHERVIIFVTFNGDTEAHNAIAWNERIPCWEVPWHFPEAVTAAFQVTEMIGPTWLSTPPTLPNGDPLDWLHASHYYATWNDIPAMDGPSLYVGTDTGFVNRFYAAPVDAPVQAIPYSATWGLRWVNETDRMEVNMVEALLVPVDGDDQVRLTLTGLSTPYDPTPVTLLDQLIDENDIASWIVRLNPSLTPIVGAFRPSNYMQFTLSGNSANGGPLFAGSVLYAFPSKRGDPLAGVGPNTATP